MRTSVLASGMVHVSGICLRREVGGLPVVMVGRTLAGGGGGGDAVMDAYVAGGRDGGVWRTSGVDVVDTSVQEELDPVDDRRPAMGGVAGKRGVNLVLVEGSGDGCWTALCGGGGGGGGGVGWVGVVSQLITGGGGGGIICGVFSGDGRPGAAITEVPLAGPKFAKSVTSAWNF